MSLDQSQMSRSWLNDRYTFVLRLCAGLLIALIVSGALNVAQFLHVAEPKYFVVDADGNIVAIVPVDKPLLNNEALSQWAAETARRAYALNFVEYDRQLSELRDRFSPAAFDAFLKQMADSNLSQIKAQRLVLEAQSEPAVITKSGVDSSGRYVWVVEVPMMVTAHYGGDRSRGQRLRVKMNISRVDNRFRPESGVVVTQFLSQLG